MKKALAVSMALTLALVGCGGQGQTAETEAPATEATEQQAEETTDEGQQAEETEEAETEDDGVYEYDETGVVITLPASFRETVGTVDLAGDGGEIPYGSGMLLTAALYTPHTADETAEFEDWMETVEEFDDVSAEKYFAFHEHDVQLFDIVGGKEGVTVDEAVANVQQQLMYGTLPEEFADDPMQLVKDTVELGEAKGYTYWLVTFDIDNPAFDEDRAAFTDEQLAEYIALRDDLVAHPEYVEVTGPQVVTAEVGSKISFETTDLDGNTVKSEDIFSQNKVTMINIWRTWCGICVEEMPELDELAKKVADRGGAIITVCADATTDDLIAEAKSTVEGLDLLTLCPLSDNDSDEGDHENSAVLPWRATPTSYFVDSEGRVLGAPVVGYMEGIYEAVFDAYLSGEEFSFEDYYAKLEADAEADGADEATETEEATAEDDAAAKADKSAPNSYVVKVTDQNGNGVPDVGVTFCTDTLCDLATTDASGVAHYTGTASSYHVKVVYAPDGYEVGDAAEGYTDATAKSLELRITKK